MNHICPTVSGLSCSSQVLISQLKEQQKIFLQCRLKLESNSSLVSRSAREACQARLRFAKECISSLEEQIEFNTALANMVLDAEAKD